MNYELGIMKEAPRAGSLFSAILVNPVHVIASKIVTRFNDKVSRQLFTWLGVI
jgi:hypothetical protein